jgi:hypothetical protein
MIVKDKEGNEFRSELCILAPPDGPPFNKTDWTVFDSQVVWFGSEVLACARNDIWCNVRQIAPGLIKMVSKEPPEYRYPNGTFRVWKLTGRYDLERDAYEAIWPD